MYLLDIATVMFAEAHQGQRRKRSDIPYYGHCLEVMKRTAHYKEKTELTHDQLLIAAMGHDILEDTDIDYSFLKSTFGKATADVVLECSRDPEAEDQKGKYDFLMSFKTKSYASVVIKVADRMCNVSDYYSDPETKEYAATYALQAYPLLNRAFREMRKRTKEHEIVGNGISETRKMLHDVCALEDIIRTQYPDFDLFKAGQEEKVREMVASKKLMKGHNKDC